MQVSSVGATNNDYRRCNFVQSGTNLPTNRTYSASPKLEQDEERKWTLLYQRDPSRTTGPRAMFGISTFNLAYWSWYCIDFSPSVNASAHEKAALGQIDPETLELLLIDPIMGYVGLGMASLIWTGSFLYTRQLVSAMWASKTTDDEESYLAVSTHKFPFLTRPKVLAKTVYDPDNNNFDGIENIEFTDAELGSESSLQVYAPGELALSEEIKRNDVIVKFDGDFSRLRGHIALKKEDGSGDTGSLLANLLKQKYLMDIVSQEEIMPNTSDTLFQSLVLKKYHFQDINKGGNYESNELDNDEGSEDDLHGNEGDIVPRKTSIKLKKGFRRKRR